MPALTNPFREDDLETRVAMLRAERDELAGELARVELQLKLLRPWSWGRFLLGMFIPVGGLLLVGVVGMALAFFGSR